MLVQVQLHLLGVDQHHPHLVGRGAHEDRGQHRVHAPGLARAGRAGHQHVRLPGQVDSDRLAVDVLAQPHGERRPALRRVLRHVAQVHHLADLVRHLDAHGALAGNRGEDAHVVGREGVRQVVAHVRDLRHLDPGRQSQLVAGHVRAAHAAHHLRLNAEVPERLHQLGAHTLVGPALDLRLAVGGLEELGLRQRVVEVIRLGDPAPLVAHRRQPLLDRPLGHRRLDDRGVLVDRLGLIDRIGLLGPRLGPPRPEA